MGNVRLSYADSNNDGKITVSSNPNETEIIAESNYYPFGLKHKGYNNVVSSNGNPTAEKFGFGGKELSEELGLEWHDFGARNYDASLGRWMNLDPLAEKYYNLSLYNYVANNPIRFIDPDGKQIQDPGDKFKTKVGAANDFAKYYNGTSITNSKEFGSALYQNKDGTYSYTVAYIGSTDSTEINENIPTGTEREGAIHTHGSEDPGYNNNEFSPADKSAADTLKQNEYVVTPSGELKEYDVKSKKIIKPTGAAKDIPSDSKSGSARVNKTPAKDTKPKYIDPKTGETHNKASVTEVVEDKSNAN